jgi:uncharacterized membrane protein YbhN (UPF0104 family)
MSSKMRHFSRWLISVGVAVTIITALVWWGEKNSLRGTVALVQAVVFIVISRWTARTASFFERIVKTKGQDVENLMKALKQMRSLYSFQRVILEISVVVLVLTSFGNIVNFMFKFVSEK